MTVKTSEEEGIGVVAIEDRTESITMRQESARLTWTEAELAAVGRALLGCIHRITYL